MTELTLQGVTGYLSNVGDVDDMAAHAIDLLSNEEKLAQFKNNALEHAKKFDIKNIMPLYEEYYMRIREEVMA